MMGKWTVTLALVAFLAGSASAAKIVDLVPGGDWVAENTDLNRAWTTTTGDYDGLGEPNDTRVLMPFETTVPMGPGSTKQSTTFYGGFQETAFDSGLNYGKTRIKDNDPNDRLIIGDNNAKTDRDEFIIALVWLESDFLSAGREIAADDAMSLTGFGGLFGSWDLQWLIKKGGTYYVSDESVSISDKTLTTWVSQGLTTTQWAPVDLDDSIDAPVGAYGTLSDLENIEGVGAYLTGTARRFHMEGFSADAVPEPATMALLGLGGLAGLLRRRR